MKRFLFAGLLLTVLTLFSCSRKKDQTTADQSTQTAQSDDMLLASRDEMPATEENLLEIVNPEEQDEEFLAQEERYGTEVLNFLEDESNFTSPVIENIDEYKPEDEEYAPEVEAVEKRLLDSYNRLKVMEYGTELFIPQTQNDSSVLIHYSDKVAVRLFYDNLYRLTKKEYWKMESVETAGLSGIEEYTYQGDSKNPVEKIIRSDSSVFVSKLNENGLVIRTEKYGVSNAGEGEGFKTIPKGAKPVVVTTWTYDDKKRITSETATEGKLVKKQVFNYAKTDGTVESSRVRGQNSQTQDEEDKDEIPPDYEYYENGVLVTKTEYIQKGVYSTTIWFDSSNWVRTDYKDYVKVRDVYFTNGVERRVKNYE